MNTDALLATLKEDAFKIMEEVQGFKNLGDHTLKPKEAGKWSVLECVKHLNLYAEFYIEAIRNAIDNSKFKQPAQEFKSGWLGNYFANSMLPGKGVKMKTFKDKDPSLTTVSSKDLDEFIRYQKELITLIDRAKSIDIGKTKTPISISTWITLKLGDTLRFYINHQKRHMAQAQGVLKNQNGVKALV